MHIDGAQIVAAAPAHKPGWQTSEFWITAVTVVGAISTAIAGVPLSPVAGIAAGVGAAAYAISRGIVKARSGDIAGAIAEAVAAAAAVKK